MFVESEFADRFFWARTRAGLGAPTVAAKIGCSAGLISNLENHGAKGSRFNDKFAKLFGVDPTWLREGRGVTPKGFSPEEAREMRRRGCQKVGRSDVIHLADRQGPRWAIANEAPDAGDANDEERADELQKRMFTDFQDYAKIVGRERAIALVEVFNRIAALVQAASEKSDRHDK